MLTRTHEAHVRTEANTQVQTLKLEVRSKKLEVRNVAHALMNAHMYEQTFGRTNMHADRQTYRQTDRQTHTYALTHARTQTHECMH